MSTTLPRWALACALSLQFGLAAPPPTALAAADRPPAAGATAAAPNAVPTAGRLLVADFDGGRLETVSGLALVALTDEQLGGTSEAVLALTHPGAGASGGALRVAFRVTDAFARPFASVFAFVGAEGLATDLTAYRGVRFHVRSRGGSFLAALGQYSGKVVRSVAPFTATPDWTLVELPFASFRQIPAADSPIPLVPKDVTTVGFSVAPAQQGSFDLEIDQLEIYP